VRAYVAVFADSPIKGGDRLVRVRPFENDDVDDVRRILDATYGYDRWVRSIHGWSHGPPIDDPHFRRTLVAVVDGDVVGVGTITHGQRHPRRSWLAIEVTPAKRRRGIGTMLLGELRGFTERPLCARGRFVDEAVIGFLHRHRFGLLERSWGGRFEPAAVVAHSGITAV
jgi:GNAT superfamily N-acetyltransferase